MTASLRSAASLAANDEKLMRLALVEARLAYEKGDVPIGAVAVYQDQVIGQAHNQKETGRDPTAHAEILALQQAARVRGGWRLPGVTLYCTMEPCPMCAGAMVQARLPRLVFAVDDPRAGAAGSVIELLRHPLLNHQVKVVRGVLASEVEALLADFFRGLRDGTVPRFSEDWRRRRLAQSGDSV
jgi:tRNA(adenine34) deaminase